MRNLLKNSKFIWVNFDDEMLPTQGLKDYILRLTGQEAKIIEIEFNDGDTDTIVSIAKDEGYGIILPSTMNEVERSFSEASLAKGVELFFPNFINCVESEAELTVRPQCGTHHLKFADFQKFAIDPGTNRIKYIDL